jgi:nitroreductase
MKGGHMNALEVIFSRRSVRLYSSKPVSREILHELLRAAMSAPSAGNERPWHFVVLTDRAVLDEIPKFHPYSAMLKRARAAVLVCGDLTLERHRGYWVLDCAAATENLLLAAHALGLGGVWCGVYPTEDRVQNFRRLLKLPDHIVPFSLVALGFPAEVKETPDRFDASRVRENTW